jgi:hypothetical protein
MSEITKKKDGPLTEERVHVLRKQMKGRRYCMDEKTEIIFLASVEDVNKYHYHLIQDYSLNEWIKDAENDYEKWAFTKLYEDLTSLNFLAESDIDDAEPQK